MYICLIYTQVTLDVNLNSEFLFRRNLYILFLWVGGGSQNPIDIHIKYLSGIHNASKTDHCNYKIRVYVRTPQPSAQLRVHNVYFSIRRPKAEEGITRLNVNSVV